VGLHDIISGLSRAPKTDVTHSIVFSAEPFFGLFPVTRFQNIFFIGSNRVTRRASLQLQFAVLLLVVERFSQPERAWAVAAAAARDLNDQLTIVLSSVDVGLDELELADPLRGTLLALRAAAERCAYTTGVLSKFSWKRGARPGAASIEGLVEP
jgi:hypothetical protein